LHFSPKVAFPPTQQPFPPSRSLPPIKVTSLPLSRSFPPQGSIFRSPPPCSMIPPPSHPAFFSAHDPIFPHSLVSLCSTSTLNPTQASESSLAFYFYFVLTILKRPLARLLLFRHEPLLSLPHSQSDLLLPPASACNNLFSRILSPLPYSLKITTAQLPLSLLPCCLSLPSPCIPPVSAVVHFCGGPNM